MVGRTRLIVDCTGPFTTAAVRDGDGKLQPIVFDGSPYLASGVYRTADGALLTGRHGADAALSDPDHYVRIPTLLIGSSPQPDEADPVELFAALLGAVRERASQDDGRAPTTATLVVPAAWGPQRRTRLRTAAHRAGFTDTTLVDAATAIASHHLAEAPTTVRRDGAPVAVCRLSGARAEATVLRHTRAGWEILAVHDDDAGDDDPPTVAAGRLAQLVVEAGASADLGPDAIAVVLNQVPPTHGQAVATAIRDAGIGAPVRGVGEFDALAGAITEPTDEPQAPRRGTLHHLLVTLVSLVAAPVLVWLLLGTAVLPHRAGDVGLDVYPAPPLLYTFWPAWSLVGLLVLLGVAAATLLIVQRSRSDSDVRRRRRLLIGLRAAAVVGTGAGVLTGVLGATTFLTVSMWAFLLASTIPVLLSSLVVARIGVLLGHGEATADQWADWLRFPSLTVVLTVIGVVGCELYWLTTASFFAHEFRPGLPYVVGQLGTVAVALAIGATLIRRVAHQIIVSPVVIAAAAYFHDYTTTWIIMGVLVIAIMWWWLRRLFPASTAVFGPD